MSLIGIVQLKESVWSEVIGAKVILIVHARKVYTTGQVIHVHNIKESDIGVDGNPFLFVTQLLKYISIR
jgi:hypothetical protein